MIFVDAGVFYARLAEDDQNHEVANLFFHRQYGKFTVFP